MSGDSGKLKTILVVEDDFGIRESMRMILESEGYQVVTAENGKVGLDKIRQPPRPSLVLLDMLMPVLNGRGFLDAVLADSALVSIPIVVVSAALNKEVIHGAVALIEKPVDLNLLLELVMKHAI